MPTCPSLVRAAVAADRPVLERLWLMFGHDLSEFQGHLPNPDGTFRNERLVASFADPDWAPYLVTSGAHPVGLALVRGLTQPARVLNSFFVVRAMRRQGIGLRAVAELVARHPGPWQIAFQDQNAAAVLFWRTVAAQLAGDEWDEERRPVPGHPELPPDVWISFSS